MNYPKYQMVHTLLTYIPFESFILPILIPNLLRKLISFLIYRRRYDNVTAALASLIF